MKSTNLIVGLIIIIIGIFILIFSYLNNRMINDMKKNNFWSYAPLFGKIIISDVDIKKEGVSTSYPKGYFITHSFNYKYKPIIVYEYTINGIKYQSQNIKPNGYEYNLDKTHALLIKNKYPVGKTVDVIYENNNPEHSYLEYGEETGLIYSFIIFMVLLIVGSVIGLTNINIGIG